MHAYLVVTLTYQDKGWTEAYRREVPALIASYGGRYLASALNPEQVEGDGDPPHALAILEFPSAKAAKSLLDSAEYQPYAKARQAGAKTTMYLLEG